MRIASKDGNMVVDFYSCTTTDNILKVLSFRGDTQKEIIISRDHFYHQVKEYVQTYKYRILNDTMEAA